MKKIIFIIASIVSVAISACGNIKSKESRELSTRISNSVLGKWYEYSSAEGIIIWRFEDDGVYYSATEEAFKKEDENNIIKKREYSIDGNRICLESRNVTLEYTSYGFRLIYDSGYEIKLYEYREDAAKQVSDEENKEKYYESIKDNNGCVIEDGVLIRYYIEEEEVTIPNNVTIIDSAAIITELEEINKLTIPGNVNKIKRSAFNEIPLGYVVIEEGVEEIGDYAFTDSYFNEIYVPESVNLIGKFAFKCSEGNHNGKIYVKKGSYAAEYFSQYNGECYGAKIIEE